MHLLEIVIAVPPSNTMLLAISLLVHLARKGNVRGVKVKRRMKVFQH